MKHEVVAVDFDGTLCENEWPNIGRPKHEIINWIKRLKSEGHKIILWTCREGEALDVAVKWCEHYGLYFDAVNDNLEEHKNLFGGDSRKVMADLYIDDKAIFPTDIPFVCEVKDDYNPTEMWQ